MDALLGEKKKEKISSDNAVPEFKRALESSEEVDEIEDAAKQMGVIVRTLITDSFGDNKYERAIECIGVMREELTNLEEPSLYNVFVRDLKKSLLSGALGGDRRDFWFKVRWSGLGLIDQKLSEVSDVTLEQAEEVSQPTLCRGACANLIPVLQVSVVAVIDTQEVLQGSCIPAS